MERLTEAIENENGIQGFGIIKCEQLTCKEVCKHTEKDGKHDCTNCPIHEAMKKLAKYEESEEEGWLVWLPCKIGNPLYEVYKKPTACSAYGKCYDETLCADCSEKCDSHYEWSVFKHEGTIQNIICLMDRIGESVFLTQPEAEKIKNKINSNRKD